MKYAACLLIFSVALPAFGQEYMSVEEALDMASRILEQRATLTPEQRLAQQDGYMSAEEALELASQMFEQRKAQPQVVESTPDIQPQTLPEPSYSNSQPFSLPAIPYYYPSYVYPPPRSYRPPIVYIYRIPQQYMYVPPYNSYAYPPYSDVQPYSNAQLPPEPPQITTQDTSSADPAPQADRAEKDQTHNHQVDLPQDHLLAVVVPAPANPQAAHISIETDTGRTDATLPATLTREQQETITRLSQQHLETEAQVQQLEQELHHTRTMLWIVAAIPLFALWAWTSFKTVKELRLFLRERRK